MYFINETELDGFIKSGAVGTIMESATAAVADSIDTNKGEWLLWCNPEGVKDDAALIEDDGWSFG